MKDRDPMDTTVIGYMLATIKDTSNHVLELKSSVARIEAKMDKAATGDELAEIRVDMIRHSKNPNAHGFIGLNKSQWAKIGGLITALTTLATVAAAYLR